MRILLVNKFLHPRGGSETYVFALGAELQRQGHQVQYFGMDSDGRMVGNRAEAYTGPMDFHGGNGITKLSYALRTIYSREARKKLRLVLEDFRPEVCHLNNIHYQLTPSILLEIRKWSRETGSPCRIIWTAHDYQLVCPNHMCRNGRYGKNCEGCLDGRFLNCAKLRCIHGSLLKSVVGAAEAYFWNRRGVYRQIDAIICCSHFLKEKLDQNPVLAEKTLVMHNFVQKRMSDREKGNYVLYFGRYSLEKGVMTLIEAAKGLPQIPFVFAGAGPLESQLEGVPNIRNAGFLRGAELENRIAGAAFTVCPSEYYENCPFSVLESLALGTPVLGADIGGIPELIQPGITGELFESGNAARLRDTLQALWEDPVRLEAYGVNCRRAKLTGVEDYVCQLIKLYRGVEPDE